MTEAWTGPQVAWKMARGRPGAFGGRTLNTWYVWLALCAVFLLGLADLRRPLSLAQPRSPRAARVLGVARVLQPRRDLPERAARLSAAALPARRGLPGSGSGAADALCSPLWPVWVLAVATVFLLGFRIGLNVETPRGVIDVGYAGVIGASRIARRPGAVRAHAGTRRPRGVRARGRRRRRSRPDPDERPLRVGERARGHVRAGVVPRLRAGGCRLRLEREVGLAPGSSCDVDRVRPADRARSRARRAPLRRHEARRGARLRVERLPVHRVHAEREHERRDHARVPRLGVLARDLTRGERRRRRARGLVEVRCAAPRAALGGLPGACGPGLSSRFGTAFLGDHARRVRGAPARAEPVGGGRDVLEPDDRVPARSQLAVLALGVGAVPRAGDPRSRLPPAGARRRGSRARARRRASCRGSRAPCSSPP